MAVTGTPRTQHDKWSFLVRVADFKSAGFQKCSEVKSSFAVVEYSEGGTLAPKKTPGRLTYDPVTLERGASDDDDLWQWFNLVADASALVNETPGAGRGKGSLEPLYKKDVDVVQLDRNGATLVTWTLFNAWPSVFTAGAWDNEADEKTIELVELTYEFFHKEIG